MSVSAQLLYPGEMTGIDGERMRACGRPQIRRML